MIRSLSIPDTNITKDDYLCDMKRIVPLLIAMCLASSALLTSCQKKDMYDTGKPFNRVTVIFFEGCSGSSATLDLSYNIRALASSPLPIKGSQKAVLYIDHSKPVPYLIRLYSDLYGNTLRDTLLTYPEKARTLDKETVRDIFGYISENFPSDHYGALISSHGSGWLPVGYYENPKTRSFGPGQGREERVEISIQDFAQAVSVHLDYLVFDACLMGGVETAYEMKDICDNVIFSCTEVPADGFDYSGLTESLLKNAPYALGKVCEDFFNMYEGSSLYGGVTVSGVDCRKIGRLADICRDLFSKYKSGLYSVDPDNVQCYGQGTHTWYYDLEDILVNCGISAEEREDLASALEECLFFRKAPDRFMSIDIKHFCGLSMYLPSAGNSFLDGYYKSLSWNTATQLVK